MSKKQADLTEQAKEGFEAPAGANCPYFDSSPSAMAWLTGQWLKTTGRTEPRDVRMSRGYTVRANDMLLSLNNPRAIERIS